MWLEAEGRGVRSPFGGSEFGGRGSSVTLDEQICLCFRTKISHVLFCLLGRKISHCHVWTRQAIKWVLLFRSDNYVLHVI